MQMVHKALHIFIWNHSYTIWNVLYWKRSDTGNNYKCDIGWFLISWNDTHAYGIGIVNLCSPFVFFFLHLQILEHTDFGILKFSDYIFPYLTFNTRNLTLISVVSPCFNPKRPHIKDIPCGTRSFLAWQWAFKGQHTALPFNPCRDRFHQF